MSFSNEWDDKYKATPFIWPWIDLVTLVMRHKPQKRISGTGVRVAPVRIFFVSLDAEYFAVRGVARLWRTYITGFRSCKITYL